MTSQGGCDGDDRGRDGGRSTTAPPPLAAEALRWRCDPARLGFQSTAEIEPIRTIVGQDIAADALRFGLESRAAGQNVFVRGLTGTGRLTLVRRLLVEMDPKCRDGWDRCYVHNFGQPDCPRLISLPRGSAREFRRLVDDLADFVRDELRQALAAEGISARRTVIEEKVQEEVKALVEPFEKRAREGGLAVVTVQMGPITHSTLFPLVEDKPMPPEAFERLHEQGQVSDEVFEEIGRRREAFEKELHSINRQLQQMRHGHAETIRSLLETEARAVLFELVARVQKPFPQPEVKAFLSEMVDDVVQHRLVPMEEGEEDFSRLYRVNVLSERTSNDRCPIILENTPTLTNLLGGVDREIMMPGVSRTDHLMIRGGSLLRADGGYLIMEARDVLGEPGAWKVLIRTLRSGRLEIVPPELALPWLAPSIKPEPIDVNVKVILIGSAETFYILDELDPDFPNLFKLLADFDSAVPRDDQSIEHYAGVLARLAREEELLHFDRTAVAALVEHGARIAARRGKLTARFGRLVDVAREGAFIAGKAGREAVTAADVHEAIRRSKRRADLPSRRLRELMADGTIQVQTRGQVVGQINGLAVIQAGPLTSGFPARISATIGPGTAGVINIEREATLSGAIHTKGFYILGGLLRRLLQTDHPLAFDASVAFEQSYGGIDGDSASGAEICCLLSALTGLPIRQSLAMTGAVDQLGNVLAIGAVNEKIEGFFDLCRDIGLTGEQGVIIPRANAGDLVLRPDLVEAAAEGRFHVYPVECVHQALELLTGVQAGARSAAGAYPADTVLGRAVARAREFWLYAAAPGPRPGSQETEEAPPTGSPPAGPGTPRAG